MRYLEILTMKKILGIILTATSYSYSSHSWAVPSAYTNHCEPLKIKNETNSTLLRDNENCQTVWVLPPTSGLSKITGFTPNGNLNLCRAIKEDQGTYNELAKSLREQAQKIGKMEEEVTAAQNQYFEISAKIIDYENLPEVKDLKASTILLQDTEDRISQLMEHLTSCEIDCEQIKEELKEKKLDRKRIGEDLRELKRSNRLMAREYEELKAQKENHEKNVNFITDRFHKALKVRIELRSLVQGFLQHYERLEGGFAHLDYNTGWEENIQTLSQKFSEFYDFKAIPTRNARIFANMVGEKDESKETYMAATPVILGYTFAGLKFIPWGENQTAELSSLPAHLSGSVRLSLIGACPLYYSNFLTVRTGDELSRSGDDKVPNFNFSIAANYEYPAAFKFNVSARYNLFKLYEKIVSSSTGSRFFWKKTEQNVSENTLDRDGFDIHWKDEDGLYSKEEKKEIAKILKDELIDRVLQNMAIPLFEKPVNMAISPMAMPQSGAVVLAKGFQESCGWNIYCRATSWILIGMDSLFGGSVAINSYKVTHDRTASETWSSTETKWRPASTGFTSL